MSEAEKKAKKKVEIPNHMLMKVQGDPEVVKKLSSVISLADQIQSITTALTPTMSAASKIITEAQMRQMSSLSEMLSQYHANMLGLTTSIQPLISVTQMLGAMETRMKPKIDSFPKESLVTQSVRHQGETPKVVNLDPA